MNQKKLCKECKGKGKFMRFEVNPVTEKYGNWMVFNRILFDNVRRKKQIRNCEYCKK